MPDDGFAPDSHDGFIPEDTSEKHVSFSPQAHQASQEFISRHPELAHQADQILAHANDEGPGILSGIGKFLSSPITSLANAPAAVKEWFKGNIHPTGGFSSDNPVEQAYGNAIAALTPTASAEELATKPSPGAMPAGTRGAVVGQRMTTKIPIPKEAPAVPAAVPEGLSVASDVAGVVYPPAASAGRLLGRAAKIAKAVLPKRGEFRNFDYRVVDRPEPAWVDSPDIQASAPVDFTAETPLDRVLPSGRTVGDPAGAPPAPAILRPPPAWANLPEATPTLAAPPPNVAPPAKLPSGRAIGGIQNAKTSIPPEVIADLMRESEAPPAAPPNTPGLPPRMAGPATATPEAAAQPTWYQQEGQRLFDEAKQRGIVDKIEELAGKRYTANETAADPTIKDALKGFGEGDFKGHDQVTLVRAVRNKLGIPSMDDTAEFNKWIQGRNAGPGTPSGEAPIIPVGPKTAAPVNGNPRMQSYVYEPEDVEPTASKGMPGAVEEPLQQMAKNAADQEMAAPLKADQAKYEAAQKAAADKGKAIQSGRQDIRAQKMADYMKAQGYHTPEQAQMLEQSPQLWESIGKNAGVLKPSKVTIGKAKTILGWD